MPESRDNRCAWTSRLIRYGGKPKRIMQVSSFLSETGIEEGNFIRNDFIRSSRNGCLGSLLALPLPISKAMESDSFGDGEREEERLPGLYLIE